MDHLPPRALLRLYVSALLVGLAALATAPAVDASPADGDTAPVAVAYPARESSDAASVARFNASLTGHDAAPVPAADAVPADGDTTWVTVANADDIRALARGENWLWAATKGGGVARWSLDGRSVRPYLSPQDGLPCNDVRDVIQWRGRWWFATCDGLAVYDAAADRMAPVAATLTSPSVTALAVDPADRLWVAGEPAWDPTATFQGKDKPGGWIGGGVSVTSDGAAWQAYRVADGLPSSNVRDLLAWRGAMWLAAEPYLKWSPPGKDPDGAPTDGRWVVAGGGVAQFDGAAWRTFDSGTVEGMSDSARVLAGSPDTLWVGSGGRGLLAYASGKWAALTDCGDAQDCIQDDFVTALAVGGDGAVWVGTARFNGRGTGLGVLDDRGTPLEPLDDLWRVYGALDGLPAERIHALMPDGTDASVWLGVAQLDPEGRVQGRGLAHVRSDRTTIEAFRSGDAGSGLVAGNDITAAALAPGTGELWVGTERSGLSVRRPDGSWRTYTHAGTKGLLASDSIADIAIEPSGVVWVAGRQTIYDTKTARWTDGGLSRFDGTTWSVLRGASAGLPSDHLSALALDGRGKLWVGTGATDRGPKEHAYRGWGLAVVDTHTGRWERTFTFPTLTSNNITDLDVSGNLLWVATAYFFYVDSRPGGAQVSTGGGVSVYNLDSGQWRKVTHQQGLTPSLQSRGQAQPLLDFRAIEVDGGGNVWVGGMGWPGGAFVPDVTPDGLVDVIGTDRVTAHRFAGAGAVTALKRGPTGEVWAGTDGGGLQVWDGVGWVRHGRSRDGLPSDSISTLSLDGGQIWVGTAGGGLAERIQRPAPRTPTPRPGTATPAPTVEPGTPVPTATRSAGVEDWTHEIYLPDIARHVVRDRPTPTASPTPESSASPSPEASATPPEGSATPESTPTPS